MGWRVWLISARLQSERRAIGAVRAATDDPRTVEQHLGLVVTPEAVRYGAPSVERTRASDDGAANRGEAMKREPNHFYSQGRSGQPPADGFAGQAEPGDLLDMGGIVGGSFENVGK